MSIWGLVAAPLMAVSAQPSDQIVAAPTAPTDVFESLTPLSQSAMADAAGGADTAIDIQIGTLISDNQENLADVDNVQISDSVTGEITSNIIENNTGLTTVFNNTGNGVVFQSNVNLNIFLGDTGAPPTVE